MSPVDVRVGVGEERVPTILDQEEQPGLVDAVLRVVGSVPGNQVVGGAEPDASFGVGIAGDRRGGQRLERADEFVVVLARPEEPHEVGDIPSVASVAVLDEVGQRCLIDLADEQLSVEAIHRATNLGAVGRLGGGSLGCRRVPEDGWALGGGVRRWFSVICTSFARSGEHRRNDDKDEYDWPLAHGVRVRTR